MAGMAVVAAAAGAVVVASRRAGLPLRRGRLAGASPGGRASRGGQTGDRWHSVTIDRTPEEVGSPPQPLGELGHTVEIRIRPAPGDRGTEVAARIREELPTGLGRVTSKLRNDDPVRHLRRALREARQLAEIGEVLLPDAPPTTDRTVTGAPLAYATRHAREEGRL
jgi:hypothetical protein